jgi:hypothetical protein
MFSLEPQLAIDEMCNNRYYTQPNQCRTKNRIKRVEELPELGEDVSLRCMSIDPISGSISGITPELLILPCKGEYGDKGECG